MLYRRTQIGYFLVGAILVPLGFVCVLIGIEGWAPFLVVPLVLFPAMIALFFRLTVEVDREAVRASFGLGWPARRIPFARVRSVRSVRNSWLMGWGIRWIPGGWMFCIQGLDAVELQLESGKRFRIGTDEPERLARVLGEGLDRAGAERA